MKHSSEVLHGLDALILHNKSGISRVLDPSVMAVERTTSLSRSLNVPPQFYPNLADVPLRNNGAVSARSSYSPKSLPQVVISSKGTRSTDTK